MMLVISARYSLRSCPSITACACIGPLTRSQKVCTINQLVLDNTPLESLKLDLYDTGTIIASRNDLSLKRHLGRGRPRKCSRFTLRLNVMSAIQRSGRS